MAKRNAPENVVCIDLTENDEENVANNNANNNRSSGGGRKKQKNNTSLAALAATIVKTETKTAATSTAQQEWASEVQVVEPAAPEIHAATSQSAAANDDDDDVVLVGTANESRLPHMRQHCPDNKFIQDIVSLSRQSHMTAAKRSELEQGKTGNASFCDLCYCFVCDKKASECSSWGSAGHVGFSAHCHASDAGNDAGIWKNKRNQVKTGGPLLQRPRPAVPRPSSTTVTPRPQPQGVGPFAPDDAQAAQRGDLTQCRCCGWYSRFLHANFTRRAHGYGWKHSHNPVGHEDWCHSCGRIASVRDFEKVQSQAYSPVAGDVFLGSKVIPFKIVAHDPRQMEKYQDRWNSLASTDPRWTYSEASMEEDFFKHRFGKFPRIEMILESVPVLEADKIPKNTSDAEKEAFQVHYSTDFEKYGTEDPGYDAANYDADGYRTEVLSKDFSCDETEGIVLTNPGDVALFEELHHFGSVASKRRAARESFVPYIGGDIVAKWEPQTRSGSFTVRVFLHSRSFSSADPMRRGSLTRLMGTWFNVVPFSLSEVSGLITAEECDKPEKGPWEDAKGFARREAAFGNVAGEMADQVQQHKATTKAKCDQLSLNSSTDCEVIGGVCCAEKGLEGILKSYFRETFASDVLDSRGYRSRKNSAEDWIERGQGIVSRHRNIRLPRETLDPRKSHYGRYQAPNNIAGCLSEKDQIVAISNLASGCADLNNKTKSLKGLLDHLENLHHPSPVPFVEGLNVELLAFQRQSVQWALERETTPDGVQSFLWGKLPSVAETDQDVYYSPILERFRRDKPRLVRGGIIAEEMGLGKTVISLALILQNPAPTMPQSGSPVAILSDANGGAANVPTAPLTWDKDLYARTSESNSKRGGIISRGTLVVCHVSLVGQWIGEAKSKLSDPGLVYPYHGQNRKRDAATLAQNAIVVTTYQTLASDATYHAKKGGADYCAPCEQVRWWRVICDESHSLSEASTQKSSACMNLVADHKWLVSGTPVSSSFNELKNQLKFIGLENVDEMFRTFAVTALKHANDPGRSKKRGRKQSRDDRAFGPFTFMMRNIMIRHTHNQKYTGTTTTLMSLPPKVERTVEVEFGEEEKENYGVLDKAARDFYTSFKEGKGHELSRHYLLLSQKLVPLRIAASGGRIPLDDEEKAPETVDEDEEKAEETGDASDEEAEEDSDEEAEEDTPAPKKKKAKKEQRYSEFAYKSKLDTLITELESARDDDPNAKSLVFSQFTSTLNFLQQELPKHGFQYRTLSGDMSMKKRAKALHDFQHDPPTTIFLLSMRAGAVGINLTQANRVFLMEPSFNPALEAQAIGRVHRLGQKRNVEIVRLVMKDSVETRIQKMLRKKYSDGSSAANDEVVAVGSRKNRRAAAPALVGSIASDRTAVLGAEFDILFGVATPKSDTSDGDGMEVEPDAAVSSQNGMSSASV